MRNYQNEQPKMLCSRHLTTTEKKANEKKQIIEYSRKKLLHSAVTFYFECFKLGSQIEQAAKRERRKNKRSASQRQDDKALATNNTVGRGRRHAVDHPPCPLFWGQSPFSNTKKAQKNSVIIVFQKRRANLATEGEASVGKFKKLMAKARDYGRGP